MENKDLFEGDIVLRPSERAYIDGKLTYGSMVGGRWPNAIVPYEFQKGLDPKAIKAINEAIARYHEYTCIRFKKKTTENEYLSFYKGGGCSSPIGYNKGHRNTISIGEGCYHTGIVQHEMGHSLGFYHEQSRPDRDKYIRIHFENIKKGMAYNFRKAGPGAIDSLGTPYDLESMMHYGQTAFTKNKKRTIEVLDWRKRLLVGQRDSFSNIDILQLNLMYKCHVPIKTVPPHQCIDQRSNCKFYKENGYCTQAINERWMYSICCKTCFGKSGGLPRSLSPTEFPPITKPVTVTTGKCVDIKDKGTCSYWARLGNCNSPSKTMREFTRRYCCATCSRH